MVSSGQYRCSDLCVQRRDVQFPMDFIDVYQMGGVSVADRSGSAAAFIPGAQGLGQTAGPFAASFMLDLAGVLVAYLFCVLSQRQ